MLVFCTPLSQVLSRHGGFIMHAGLSLGLVMLVFCGPPLQVLSCSHVVKVFCFSLQVLLYGPHHAWLCFTGLVVCIWSCRSCWTDLSCFTGLVTHLVIQALSCTFCYVVHVLSYRPCHVHFVTLCTSCHAGLVTCHV